VLVDRIHQRPVQVKQECRLRYLDVRPRGGGHKFSLRVGPPTWTICDSLADLHGEVAQPTPVAVPVTRHELVTRVRACQGHDNVDRHLPSTTCPPRRPSRRTPERRRRSPPLSPSLLAALPGAADPARAASLLLTLENDESCTPGSGPSDLAWPSFAIGLCLVCSIARNCSYTRGRSPSLPGFRRIVMSCAHMSEISPGSRCGQSPPSALQLDVEPGEDRHEGRSKCVEVLL